MPLLGVLALPGEEAWQIATEHFAAAIAALGVR
jgi:hypothetical protein